MHCKRTANKLYHPQSLICALTLCFSFIIFPAPWFMKIENEKFILDEGSRMESGGGNGSKRFSWINLRKISVSSLSACGDEIGYWRKYRVLNGLDVVVCSLIEQFFNFKVCSFFNYWILGCLYLTRIVETGYLWYIIHLFLSRVILFSSKNHPQVQCHAIHSK